MKHNLTRRERANIRLGYHIDRPVSKYQMWEQWYVDNTPWSSVTVIIPGSAIALLIFKFIIMPLLS